MTTRACVSRTGISAMLFAVRNSLLLAVVFVAAITFFPRSVAQTATPQGTPPAAAPQQTAPASPTSQPSLPPTSAAPPAPAGPLIVLDPAHGGTDFGARGANGGVEKEIVLQIARTVRAGLERQGFHVVLTRNDDSNPSFDDRAAIANGNPGATFISLHISSTGTGGTARAYYNQFSSPVSSAILTSGANASPASPVVGGLILWDEAQRPYLDASRHLADIMQSELAKVFSGSPAVSSSAPVRGLRSIAEPAIAIEISSVSTLSQDALMALATPLTTSVARGISAIHQNSAAGAQ
jgi:N-acetylmuramoyl-L-alanine amidase